MEEIEGKNQGPETQEASTENKLSCHNEGATVRSLEA